MKKDVRFKVAELPPRPRRMNDDELSRIFGGCGATSYGCSQHKDCCSGKCSMATAGSGYCYSAQPVYVYY